MATDIDIKYILNESNKYITKEYIENTLKMYGVEYKVSNIDIFIMATTHNTYIKNKTNITKKNSKYKHLKEVEPIGSDVQAIQLGKESYERLEFVGDSVIHLILAKYLWTRYETQNEGFMTRLRIKIENGVILSKLSKVIGLNKYILISRAMEKMGYRETNYHILEDLFEAFIAALFIDSKNDYNICEKFVISLIEKEIDLAEVLHKEDNYKDILLRYFHKQKWQDPMYGKLNITMNDNKKEFTIYVKKKSSATDDGEIVGMGIASSRKKGEQLAAKEALIKYGIIKKAIEYDSESYESFSDKTDEDLSIIDDDSFDDKNYNLSDNEDS